MKCHEIMSRNLEWASERETVQRVATLMADENVGFLPVCGERGEVVGVLTDRDLATRVVAPGRPGTTLVAEVMTRPVVTCSPEMKVDAVEAMMVEQKVLRTVVVDEAGKPVGVLSLADLLEHASRRKAVRTARNLLLREALGPRGGAAYTPPMRPPAPRLDEPAPEGAEAVRAASGTARSREAVYTGGGNRDLKEFPG